MSELLIVKDLEVEFSDRGVLTNRPLRGINMSVAAGEILGVVGETGCGKTMTGLAVLGLLPTGAIVRGHVSIGGLEHSEKSNEEMLRGKVVSLVFQNPGTAFNPVFTLGDQMHDVLRRHTSKRRKEATEHILNYLGLVGLPDPLRVMKSYPHELSGGMLQRAMIAMALLSEPRLLILDEPTTALDVTVAKQILELIVKLRERFGFGVLLITHNLGVVRDICDRVVVLYAGRVIETGATEVVLGTPSHPYTRGLIGALPSGQRRDKPLDAIAGNVPSNLLGIVGCSFAERCAFVAESCRTVDPQLNLVGALHESACIRSATI